MFTEVNDQSVLAKGQKWLTDYAQEQGHLDDRTILSIEALFRYNSKRIFKDLNKSNDQNPEIAKTKRIIRTGSENFAQHILKSSEKIQGYAKSHFRRGMVSL